MAAEVDIPTIRLLSRLADLDIPAEDLEPLAAALQGHLASAARIRERYGALPSEPPLEFDARWD